ncbi:unnamed protein product [Dibothriocephalus latus]|uniref:Integrase catalytic domain-containing protein n=1 Tax=Dibothriocephalus latus TaxID=60516 RepID=A0A3P7M0P9_DIBLA|nr:unnamed protein product [Dibothriocephalus latus]
MHKDLKTCTRTLYLCPAAGPISLHVDQYIRWPEAIPIPDVSSPTAVMAFQRHYVAIFGAPSIIMAGRGCSRICNKAYHPPANRMVERLHRHLKASLRAAVDPENWTYHISLVFLGIRSSFKPDVDCSAAELVFSVPVRLPGEMILPSHPGAVEDPANPLHQLRQFL